MMEQRVWVLAIAVPVLLALAAPVKADCVGDCNGDGNVVVNELITGINIALGTTALSECPSFDVNDDGVVSVAELITAINNALTGCKTTAVCGNGKKEAAEECDDGNTFGGDGCAANCTSETDHNCTFSGDSIATLQTILFAVSLPLEGSQSLTIGKATDSSGEIPAVIKADSMHFAPVSLAGVACVCVRGGNLAGFGPGNAAYGTLGCGQQGLADVSYLTSMDHNTNATDPNCEFGDLEYDVPCVDSGCGARACQGGTLNKDSCTKDADCKAKHPGVCNGKRQLEFTGGGSQGSMFLYGGLSISLIVDGGACVKNCNIATMGPDCLPCTADDCNEAEPSPMPFTSGTAVGEVLDANNQLGPPPAKIGPGSGTACTSNEQCTGGEKCWNREEFEACSGGSGCTCERICTSDVCLTEAAGHVLDCGRLVSDPNQLMSGGTMAGAAPFVDSSGGLGDNVVTGVFACE
jgi:cysteine-rich repeat protein